MANRQHWRRLGFVYNASGGAPWMASHAAYPTPLPLADGTVRVYFSPRDTLNRGCITALLLALDGDRFHVLEKPRTPLLSHGPHGAFDDSGVTVGCVVPDGDEIRVYYLGWSLAVTVPFHNFIGLAIGARSGGPLRRVSPVPVVDRSAIDPFTISYPWVLREGAVWRMWYGSHLCWGKDGQTMRHVIRHARSADGQYWHPSLQPAIPLADPPEFAVSRPCVLKDADRYRMWYARRSPDYGLGYAESSDGENWVRADAQLEITGPVAAWESKTMEYATVFDHAGHRYMLYNGNGYGRTGFGLAILER